MAGVIPEVTLGISRCGPKTKQAKKKVGGRKVTGKQHFLCPVTYAQIDVRTAEVLTHAHITMAKSPKKAEATGSYWGIVLERLSDNLQSIRPLARGDR